VPHPFVEHGRIEAIAHRGGDLAGTENTLEAFQAAVDLGYRHLETDVHATRDGVLVAFHDTTLDRVTDAAGAIAQRTITEVRAARVLPRAQRAGGTTSGATIPLFDEVVASFPEVRLTVDIKADTAVTPMIERLARDARLLERVCIGSFSDARLAAVRERLGRRVCTSAGPREVLRMRASVTTLARAPRGLVADCLQVPQRFAVLRIVDAVLVRVAELAGLPIHVWTVNDVARMEALLDLGVAGIVTDDVVALKGVLERRGLW